MTGRRFHLAAKQHSHPKTMNLKSLFSTVVLSEFSLVWDAILCCRRTTDPAVTSSVSFGMHKSSGHQFSLVWDASLSWRQTTFLWSRPRRAIMSKPLRGGTESRSHELQEAAEHREIVCRVRNTTSSLRSHYTPFLSNAHPFRQSKQCEKKPSRKRNC